jgi:A/G-specific adenine glycosylase
MLQQTTVKAVIPYYAAFLDRWPTIAALAAAPRDEVLTAWAGLGYYSRARNLHACAQLLAENGFPSTEAALRSLPGVGAYTAAAIAAIAFGEPAVVVDGNVERVIARLFAIADPLPDCKPQLRELAAALTPKARPGDYAQSMMDLGATICTPRSPSCLVCAVREWCKARQLGDPTAFPKKKAKAAKPERRGTAFVAVRREGGDLELLLRQRQDNGLLGGMMEVPSVGWSADEAAEPIVEALARANAGWIAAGIVAHTFTHFHLWLDVRAKFVDPDIVAQGFWAPLARLKDHALPSVMRKAVVAGLHALEIPSPYASRAGRAAIRASSI